MSRPSHLSGASLQRALKVMNISGDLKYAGSIPLHAHITVGLPTTLVERLPWLSLHFDSPAEYGRCVSPKESGAKLSAVLSTVLVRGDGDKWYHTNASHHRESCGLLRCSRVRTTFRADAIESRII